MTVEVGVEKSSEWQEICKKTLEHSCGGYSNGNFGSHRRCLCLSLVRSQTLNQQGLVPATLGLWSMANIISFILNAIFWELVLIGIPVVIGAILGWQWWKRLPDEEKKEYHFFGKAFTFKRCRWSSITVTFHCDS